MRNDAQRNRERLVEVARELFRDQGADASLNEIARRAGVGIGTLYRHFPAREDLQDAVMQDWIGRVRAAAEAAVAEAAVAPDGPPRARLLAWFRTYAGLLCAFPGVAALVTAALGDDDSPIVTKWTAFDRAMGVVLDAVAPIPGIDSLEACRLVGSIAMLRERATLDDDAVERLLGVVVDGLLEPGRATR